jgi:hypothetical protein
MVAVGGQYHVVRRDGVVSSSVIPTVSGLLVSDGSLAANIDQVNLNMPSAGFAETVSFYAAATTYPVTSVSAPAPATLPAGARVTLAQGLTTSVEQLAIPNAFSKVMDSNGDVVSYKNVKTAYAYAWAQGDSTGNVHPIHVATAGIEATTGIARLTDVSVDATDGAITVNAASLFSATSTITEYYVFAVKSEGVTGPEAVRTFVSQGTIGPAFSESQRYTALGEHHTFETPVPEDDQHDIPGYMNVMTEAFTDLSNANSETLTDGSSYTVYLVAKTGAGNWFLGATESLLIDLTATPTTDLATIGEIQNVTFDNSVQNDHTVSFGLRSVTASDLANAKVYAAVFTRDLKYEKHSGSLGEYKNEVYSAEAKLTPILEVPAGTSVSLGPFTIGQAIDTNGDLVDLYTVNAGYLYVWANTLESAEFAGGRSVIQGVEYESAAWNVFVPLPEFTFTIDGNEYSRSASDPLYQITLDEETDADPNKTPWVLVLNYIHKRGTNPEANVRDTTTGFPVLPTDGSLDFANVHITGTDPDGNTYTMPDGSVDHPDSWGHTGNDLFNKLCIALGSTTGIENGVEVRLIAKTSNHSRLIHFKTDYERLVQQFRDGLISQSVSENLGSSYTLYADHSATYIPQQVDYLFKKIGDSALQWPMDTNGVAYYTAAIDGRYEVDNYTTNSGNHDTYHQIWVRANKA